MQFEDADLVDELNAMSLEDYDRAGFGIIAMSGDGTITAYNLYEQRAAGLAPANVIGRNFFSDVGACTDNALVAGRFREEPFLDAIIPYVFTFRLKTTPVRLRLLQRPGDAIFYLLVERT